MLKSAGIVLYEPNIQRLHLLLRSIVHQSDVVFIIDNSQNELDLLYFSDVDLKKIFYHRNPINIGLAKSLSSLCNLARSHNISWLLTLDQDSIVSDNFYDNYIKYIDIDIGLLCPIVIEDRFDLIQQHKILHTSLDGKLYVVESAITSGSYLNLAIQEKIGFFEDLFVDSVDNDYSYSLRDNGFKIMCVTENFIYHEFGDSELTFLSKITNQIIGKIHPSLIRRNHSPIRIYYQIRNMIILNRKWRSNRNEFVKSDLIKTIISMSLKVILVEKRKVIKLYKVILGIVDGLSYNFIEERQ